MGGNVDVPLHVDGIILNPTLEVDGEVLIKDGKWTFLENKIEIPKTSPTIKPESNESVDIRQNTEEKDSTNNSLGYSINTPYVPYIVQEPLESHYFDPWIGGWTRLNGRFVINPDLYGEMRKIVEIHEKIHNIYKTGNEAFVESMTNYIFRNNYHNLSQGYS
jgi:hypothetical protein